jgi:CheY-like chemotaxis protein
MSLRVLIVDDCADNRDSLQLLTRLWGHEVRAYADGAAALAEAAAFRPNVALLDLGLPRLDGCELARRLRQLPGLDALKLIAVTGHVDLSSRRQAAEAGFMLYLVKPLEPPLLERLLTELAAASVAVEEACPALG